MAQTPERAQAEESAPSPGELYLLERGVPIEAASRFGIEIESPPQAERFSQRLGMQCPAGVECIVWFPVLSKAGATDSWIARLLSAPEGWPKFLCGKDSGGPPWMRPGLYDQKADEALFVT